MMIVILAIHSHYVRDHYVWPGRTWLCLRIMLIFQVKGKYFFFGGVLFCFCIDCLFLLNEVGLRPWFYRFVELGARVTK